MGKVVLLDAVVTVDAVELSDHADKVTITSSKDLVETTSFGAVSKQNLIGLGDATIAVEFFQDFDASSVDATLWPLHESGETFDVVIKPTSGGVSATNPSYTMTAVLPEFAPLDAGVGEASKVTVTFQNAGADGITRATA